MYTWFTRLRVGLDPACPSLTSPFPGIVPIVSFCILYNVFPAVLSGVIPLQLPWSLFLFTESFSPAPSPLLVFAHPITQRDDHDNHISSPVLPTIVHYVVCPGCLSVLEFSSNFLTLLSLSACFDASTRGSAHAFIFFSNSAPNVVLVAGVPSYGSALLVLPFPPSLYKLFDCPVLVGVAIPLSVFLAAYPVSTSSPPIFFSSRHQNLHFVYMLSSNSASLITATASRSNSLTKNLPAPAPYSSG